MSRNRKPGHGPCPLIPSHYRSSIPLFPTLFSLLCPVSPLSSSSAMLVPSNLLCIVVLLQAASNLALPSSSLLYHRDSDNISTVPPSQDPFYQVPADVALYPRGHIFRSRRVSDPTTVFGPDAGDTHQLLFRTNGVHLNPDAAVTIVIAPRVPARGPPKIVAIASPEDSPAVDCATSWALYPHSHSKEAAGGNPFSVLTAMSALYNGWYVVLPDQEGSKAGWEAYSEGQVVLDSIRAIVNHKETIRDCEGYQAALTGCVFIRIFCCTL